MPTPCPHPGRDLGSSSSVSPGTPLPPPRVAVPGESRRAGSVSWGAVSLFVRPLPPTVPSAPEGGARSPPPPARSTELLREIRPSPLSGCASSPSPVRFHISSPSPRSRTSQGHLPVHLWGCSLPRAPLHLLDALSQCRSISKLQVARAEASSAGHLSRAPQVSARRMRS